MPNTDDYTVTPTHVRIFHDDEWFVDGADDALNFTESCWSYDTFEEAIAAVREFIDHAVLSGVVWSFSVPRKPTHVRRHPRRPVAGINTQLLA